MHWFQELERNLYLLLADELRSIGDNQGEYKGYTRIEEQ